MAGSLVTGAGAPTAVVEVQPGMLVQAVTLVDENGLPVSAGIATALATLTTPVVVSAATAPTVNQVLTATSGSAATWQASASGFANPMTTLGDIIYENATPAPARLAGGTVATKQYLTQTGTGSASAAPAWGTIAAGDVPTLNQNTTGTALNVTGTVATTNGGTGQVTAQAAMDSLAGAQTSGDYLRGNGTNVQMSAIQAADLPAATTSVQGAVVLDGTAGDIQALAASAAAGSKGQAADAKHVHPWTGLALLNDPMQFGVAIDFFPGLLTILATVNTANNGCYTKLTSGGYAFSNLNIDVGVASGNISVAVYTTSGTGMSAAPTGGQLTTSGAVACPASGIATVSLGSSVTPHLGDWVGLSCDNTTATILRAECNTFQGTLFLPGFGSLQASAHPLPSTPSSLTASASVGNFMMRGS